MKTISVKNNRSPNVHGIQASKAESPDVCPDGKYWVSPHTRKRIDKKGKLCVQSVNGYCCSYHDNYAQLAEEEQMQFDHLFLALTVYGETAMENIATKKAVAWVIRNRCNATNSPKKYRDVVLKRKQFSCWLKSDPNYKRMQHPGRHDPIDQRAWQECKLIAEEVNNESEKNNPIPGVYHYFSGAPNTKNHPWQKNYFDLPGIPHLHFVKLKY